MSKHTAIAKNVRISPQKARLVADLIRHEGAEDALTRLEFTLKKAAPIIQKVLKSAIANAENKGGLDPENLIIEEIFVDTAPTLKRHKAGAKGSAKRIIKRASHITVVVSEKTSGGK
jgi:large subunit ribosomal protein L22